MVALLMCWCPIILRRPGRAGQAPLGLNLGNTLEPGGSVTEY